MKNKNIGSNFDDFLHEEGILAEVESAAIKEIISKQIIQLMNKQKISKVEMSQKMGTSRSAFDRLLNPQNTSLSLKTLSMAALSLGKKINIRLS
jgi:antitoxin HicB